MRRKLIRKAKRGLNNWACNGPAANLGQAVLRAIGRRLVLIGNLQDDAPTVATLSNASPYCVESPRWNGQVSLVRSGEFPEICARKLERPMFTISSSAFLKEDRIYLPELVQREKDRLTTNNEGLFFYGSRNKLIGIVSPRAEIDEGIFIGGSGSSNWYHFVIECLPKAYLAQRLPAEFDHFPLLVPEECQQFPSFAEALSLFSGERDVRFLEPTKSYAANALLLIDEVSVGPFNMVAGEWPRVNDYAQHDIELRKFIEEFRSKLGVVKRATNVGRRIFLKRPANRRSYNQGELCAIAERYGFEPVSPENLSLSEQAALFAEAEMVIGPSGAAWVGMIFCEWPMKGLSWLPAVYTEFCGYSSLAKLLGHDLDFIEAQTDTVLTTSEQVYSAGYKVCPVRFESAVRQMVG